MAKQSQKRCDDQIAARARRSNGMVPDKRAAKKKTGRLQMSRPAEFSARMRNKRTLSYGQTCTVRTR
jgi:hypothetical protein